MAYSRNRMFFGFSTMVMLCLALYIAQRLLWNVPFSLWEKWGFFILILALSQSISIMRLLVTRAAGYPFYWMRIGGYASTLFILLGSLTFLRDICLLLLQVCGEIFSLDWVEDALSALMGEKSVFLLLCISALAAGTGMWSALRVPRVRKRELNLKNLPSTLDGLRIVQLSDLHMGSTYKALWLEKVVEKCNALAPDLVLITGDLVDNTPAVLTEDMRLLTRLRARLGVLIAVGNHEYYTGLMPWVDTWRNMGLDVLLNQWKAFEMNGEKLIVAGVADASAEKYPGLLLPDARAARAGAPEGFTILMAHQPRAAVEYAKLGYDLQLSGHTHGGQYFFLFPLISFLNKGFRSGSYVVDSMILHVSPGTGLWGYVPIRIGASSEISLLVLRAAAKSPLPGKQGSINSRFF